MKLLAFKLFIFIQVSNSYGQIFKTDVLPPATINCNKVTSKYYFFSPELSFCDYSIALNSDSSFVVFDCCENSCYLSTGSWEQIDSEIVFTPAPLNTVNLFKGVKYSTSTNNKKVTFIIKDKTGKPLNLFPIFPIVKKVKYIYRYYPYLVENPDYTDALVYSDSNGVVSFEKKKFSFMTFPTINFYSNNNIQYKTDILPDTIEICVNLNSCAFVIILPLLVFFTNNSTTLYYLDRLS